MWVEVELDGWTLGIDQGLEPGMWTTGALPGDGTRIERLSNRGGFV